MHGVKRDGLWLAHIKTATARCFTGCDGSLHGSISLRPFIIYLVFCIDSYGSEYNQVAFGFGPRARAPRFSRNTYSVLVRSPFFSSLYSSLVGTLSPPLCAPTFEIITAILFYFLIVFIAVFFRLAFLCWAWAPFFLQSFFFFNLNKFITFYELRFHETKNSK